MKRGEKRAKRRPHRRRFPVEVSPRVLSLVARLHRQSRDDSRAQTREAAVGRERRARLRGRHRHGKVHLRAKLRGGGGGVAGGRPGPVVSEGGGKPGGFEPEPRRSTRRIRRRDALRREPLGGDVARVSVRRVSVLGDAPIVRHHIPRRRRRRLARGRGRSRSRLNDALGVASRDADPDRRDRRASRRRASQSNPTVDGVRTRDDPSSRGDASIRLFGGVERGAHRRRRRQNRRERRRHRGRVGRARLILEEQTTTTAPAVFRHVAKIDVRHVLHPRLVRGDERREKRRRRRRRAVVERLRLKTVPIGDARVGARVPREPRRRHERARERISNHVYREFRDEECEQTRRAA